MASFSIVDDLSEQIVRSREIGYSFKTVSDPPAPPEDTSVDYSNVVKDVSILECSADSNDDSNYVWPIHEEMVARDSDDFATKSEDTVNGPSPDCTPDSDDDDDSIVDFISRLYRTPDSDYGTTTSRQTAIAAVRGATVRTISPSNISYEDEQTFRKSDEDLAKNRVSVDPPKTHYQILPKKPPAYKDQVVSVIGESPGAPEKVKNDCKGIEDDRLLDQASRTTTRTVRFACSEDVSVRFVAENSDFGTSCELQPDDSNGSSVWKKFQKIFCRANRRNNSEADRLTVPALSRDERRSQQSRASSNDAFVGRSTTVATYSKARMRKMRSKACQRSFQRIKKPRFFNFTRSLYDSPHNLANRVLQDSIQTSRGPADPPTDADRHPSWPLSTVDPPSKSLSSLSERDTELGAVSTDPPEDFRSFGSSATKPKVSDEDSRIKHIQQRIPNATRERSTSRSPCLDPPSATAERPGVVRMVGFEEMTAAKVESEAILSSQGNEIGRNGNWSQSSVNQMLSPDEEINEAIDDFRKQYRIVQVDSLRKKLTTSRDALDTTLDYFSKVGDIYFVRFSGTEEMLSRYVILDMEWLDRMRRAFVRADWKCAWRTICGAPGDTLLCERLFGCPSSNCPLITESMLKKLWLMTECVDGPGDRRTCDSQIFNVYSFLQHLFAANGDLVPLGIGEKGAGTNVYLVPGLLFEVEDSLDWTFLTPNSYMTTLCHSWLIRDGAPAISMGHLAAAILRSMHHHLLHTHIGVLKIIQLMLWKSSMLFHIGLCTADRSGRVTESTVEVFLAFQDGSLSHSVASSTTTPGTTRLIVCGKGEVGHHGRKIWDGGFKTILNAVHNVMSCRSGIDYQVICTKCLSKFDSRDAATMDCKSVYMQARQGIEGIFCSFGHRVSPFLLTGSLPRSSGLVRRSKEPVEPSEAFPGVVLIMVWNPQKCLPVSLGSGFVVAKEQGLIVSAAHTVIDLHGKRPYYGVRGAKIIVGVIRPGSTKATFRYTAKIIAEDIRNVDAIVLQITGQLSRDVGYGGNITDLNQPEIAITPTTFAKSDTKQLDMTHHFALDQTFRILGFNQGGEGVFLPRTHVSHTIDVTRGYICGEFEVEANSVLSEKHSIVTNGEFSPRREIVAACTPPTIDGQSGGPCLDNEGKVLGILSRSDSNDSQRTYLVPAAEIAPLIQKAQCT